MFRQQLQAQTRRRPRALRAIPFRQLSAENLEARLLLAADLPRAAAPAAFESRIDALIEPLTADAVSLDDVLALSRHKSYVPHEVIVSVQGGDDAVDEVVRALQSDGFGQAELLNELLTLNQTGTHSLVQLGLGREGQVIEALHTLEQADLVEWSVPNFVYEGPDVREFIPNDPRYANQWHHGVMDNPSAWDVTLGDASIVVGITDDGIDIDHPDLDDALWTNSGEIPGNNIDDDGNGYIDDVNGYNFLDDNNVVNADAGDSHGTHVAGIVGAEIDNAVGVAGTAGGVTILPLKWFDGSGWTSAIVAETFTYAADNGAQIVNTSYNMDVWAGNPVVTAAFQYMYDAGVLHFNSAGNGNDLNPPRQVFEQTLFVANTNSADVRNGSSNYGDGVDVAAPGTSIHSTVIGTYGNSSGTSMAAPNAAAVAAMIWSANPTWTRDQVVAQLLGTADNIDAQNPAYIGLLGSGRVNTGRALTEALGAPQIHEVAGLPTNGVSAAANTISDFSVSFTQYMDPASVLDAGSYDLREAGADGVFDTADDITRSLSPETTYMVGTNSFDVSIDGEALGNGSYRVRLVSGGLQNPFGTALDGDADGTAGDHYEVFFTVDYQPTLRTTLEGSGASISAGNVDLISIPSSPNTHVVLGEPGESMTAVVRPLAAVTVTGQFSAVGTAASSAMPGDSIVVPQIVIPASGQVALEISADAATSYEFDILRNVNADAIVDLSQVVPLAGSEVDSGSYRASAIGQANGNAGTPDVDEFTIQLAAGSSVDVVLKGGTASFGNQTLRLTDDGGAVLATATVDQATNYDLGILDFVAPLEGEYTVRLDAEMTGEYELLVAEELVFETTALGSAMLPDRRLDDVDGAIGYLDDRGFSYSRVNHIQSFVDIASTGTPLGLSDDGVQQVTTSVGNVLLPAGTVSIANHGGVIAGVDTLPQSNLPLPYFGFDEALLVYWDDWEATSGEVYWQELQVGGVDTLIVQWDDRTHFTTGDTVTFQLQVFDSGPVLARFVYQDANTGHPAIDGGRSATIGIQRSSSEAYPFSYNATSINNGDVIDFLAADVDRYAIDLDANVAMNFSTQTPLDASAGNLPNNANPALQIRDIGGNVVLSDSGSLDGKNATIDFSPATAGTYFVEVLTEGSPGEYELIGRRVPTGDFDFDGDFDTVDIDLLVAAIVAGNHPSDFDLTGDQNVDLMDRDAWLVVAGSTNLPSGNPYLLGDANLDGAVDGVDFVAWNSNKFQSVAAWSAGDFDADGFVNGQDFVIWNANKFTMADRRHDSPGLLELAWSLDEEEEREA